MKTHIVSLLTAVAPLFIGMTVAYAGGPEPLAEPKQSAITSKVTDQDGIRKGPRLLTRAELDEVVAGGRSDNGGGNGGFDGFNNGTFKGNSFAPPAGCKFCGNR